MSTTSIDLSAVVMAVPERKQLVKALLQKLELKDNRVVWDKDHHGHLFNWCQAVDLALASKPSHILIIEDDAEPCRDLLAGVIELIKLYPDRIFSLFSNSREINRARQQGLSLVKSHRTLSDMAMVYPADWLQKLKDDYLSRADKFVGKGADEMRVKLRPMLEVWLTVPSLVDHNGEKSSALSHKYYFQRARWFLGSKDSALSVDWSKT